MSTLGVVANVSTNAQKTPYRKILHEFFSKKRIFGIYMWFNNANSISHLLRMYGFKICGYWKVAVSNLVLHEKDSRIRTAFLVEK